MDPVRGVDLAFWYILGISLLLLVGITAVMIYFVIRYRRSKHPDPVDIRDNLNLEVVWTVRPTPPRPPRRRRRPPGPGRGFRGRG